MANLKKFAQKVISIFVTILSEFSWLLVDFMLLMAFLWLTTSTVKTFLGEDLTRELVISYLGGIALCLSLASVLFSYARVCEKDEKQKIVNSGRAILNGGIVLLMSFMLNFYLIQASEGHWDTIQVLYNYTRPFALAGSIVFTIVSALELRRGFNALIGWVFY